MLDFAQHLRSLRIEKNLTQKRLAEITGLTERGVQKYELGERKPNFDAIIALSKALQISADVLLGLKEL